MSDLAYWKEGARIIEGCLAKATRADPGDVPFPLLGNDAVLWHRAQASAYQHALEMMAPPTVPAAATEQPAPVPNGSVPIAELVLQDVRDRRELGLKRYGTFLQANNGRDALMDAYQEALDLVMYLRQAIAERDGR